MCYQQLSSHLIAAYRILLLEFAPGLLPDREPNYTTKG